MRRVLNVLRCRTLRCVDYVRLYLDLESPAVNERHEWNYELCDDHLTTAGLDKYYSSTSCLMMAFHADKFASNRTGFRAFYRFIDKRNYETESHQSMNQMHAC